MSKTIELDIPKDPAERVARRNFLVGDEARLRAALEWITEHHTDMQGCLAKAREALKD